MMATDAHPATTVTAVLAIAQSGSTATNKINAASKGRLRYPHTVPTSVMVTIPAMPEEANPERIETIPTIPMSAIPMGLSYNSATKSVAQTK